MHDYETTREEPISIVRFGIGKEMQLYRNTLVITGQEDGYMQQITLSEIKRLILLPGEPTPSKLILMADLANEDTVVLVDGMTNARGFREMLPHLEKLLPDLQLDPPDMAEQLRQALNNRRAWTLTCYGAIALLCISLYVLYLIVAYLRTLHL
jgi:hypothetical protein